MSTLRTRDVAASHAANGAAEEKIEQHAAARRWPARKGPGGLVIFASVTAVLALVLVAYLRMPAPASLQANEPSVKIVHSDQRHSHCARSLRESDGFICERDDLWEIEKQAARRMADKQAVTFDLMCRGTFSGRVPYAYGFQQGVNWYQMYWEPELSCVKERVGVFGDGGKYVCHTDSLEPEKPCLVYSAGSNNDFSFEDDMHTIWPHCEIHTFDPTLKERHLQPKNPSYVNFHPWGLSGQNDPARMYFTLSEVMRRLNHTGRDITVFKVDIEHAEYETFEAMGREGSFPFQQLLIEVHDPKKNGQLFLMLREHGFAIFAKEVNFFGIPCCMEYVFGRVGRAFFEMIHDPWITKGYQCNESVINAGKLHPTGGDQKVGIHHPMSRVQSSLGATPTSTLLGMERRKQRLVSMEKDMAAKLAHIAELDKRAEDESAQGDAKRASQSRAEAEDLRIVVRNLEVKISAMKDMLSSQSHNTTRTLGTNGEGSTQK
ncbi:hypothetical protein FVE85_7127 [Porphyridium purpureum]|uniref:Methyltransferase domain-containing protein n=1 Tax=Porphyridium purpureum TaxID=35688 RepID=A0A5J4Z910_PORPP|nr:hypothetical protein FVE85_7127 [Porphyridium purpureum]|eukprot:POR3866..scf295_1